MEHPFTRLDVPGPGRLLGTEAERLALRFRRAAVALGNGHSVATSATYDRLFAPRDSCLGVTSKAGDPRPPWAVLGMFAVALLRAGADVDNLRNAEEWFHGGHELTATFSADAIANAQREFYEVDPQTLADLLPYAIDPHGPGTRRSVIRDPTQKDAQSTRRRHGIYYTPGDVAEYMARQVMPTGGEAVLDPACGTGVFLRACGRIRAETVASYRVLENLRGIDIDPLAVDGACFILCAALMPMGASDGWRWWHLARLNLAHRDALTLLGGSRLADVTDYHTAAKARSQLRAQLLDCPSLPTPIAIPRPEWGESVRTLFPEAPSTTTVLGNPPYAPIGARKDLGSLGRQLGVFRGAAVTPATNAFLPFLEYLWLPDPEALRSSFVVPLSIAYNTNAAYRSARQAMRDAGGHWSCWFFDRTPDSLFGDDVKQRAAVVVRDSGRGYSLATSGLHRWTSQQRSKLFAQLPAPIELGPVDIAGGMPKLGAFWEQSAWESMRRNGLRLSTSLTAQLTAERDRHALHIGSTGYNRLVVYRDGGEEYRVSGTTLFALDETVADWAYAILSSNLAYWLWRVEGDGFHVPAGWVAGLPFTWPGSEPGRELSRLGRRAWRSALQRPITAVNRGVKTVSYAPKSALVSRIDRALLTTVGLEPHLAEVLEAFRRATIDVGRGGRENQ